MAKVLIVDDDRTMVSLLRTLLELDGFAVASAPAGGLVMGMLQSEKPDVLLMDVHLADVDGLDILRQIRGSADFAEMPVVMSSGMDLEDQCLGAGATAFMLKPYPPEDLAKVLSGAIAAG